MALLRILLVLKGSVKVGSPNSKVYQTFNTIVLSSNENEDGVQLTSAEDDTELILVCYKLSEYILNQMLIPLFFLL